MLKTTNSKLICQYIKEYQDYYQYLDEQFFEETYTKFLNTPNIVVGINRDVYFGIYLRNQVDFELCKLARNGNIDLEIQLIDRYTPILNMILSKLQWELQDKEGIIILAIETYDGEKMFSQHILRVLRNPDMFQAKTDEFSNIEEHTNNQISPINENVDEPIESFLENSTLVSCELTDIETLFINLKVIYFIKDEKLKKYAELKYGYHNNVFFSNSDIAQILDSEMNEIIKMNKECLNILLNVINKSIDMAILLTDQFNSGKQYLKIDSLQKS